MEKVTDSHLLSALKNAVFHSKYKPFVVDFLKTSYVTVRIHQLFALLKLAFLDNQSDIIQLILSNKSLLIGLEEYDFHKVMAELVKQEKFEVLEGLLQEKEIRQRASPELIQIMRDYRFKKHQQQKQFLVNSSSSKKKKKVRKKTFSSSVFMS